MKVIEVVGLPGTGKSTVTRALLAGGGGRVGLVKLRGWRKLPLLLRNAVRCVLPAALQYRKLPEHRWKRFSQMVQLLTYYDAVAAQRRERELLLLDQGPIYLMAMLQRTLLASGGDSRLYETLWNATLQRWARRLDAVVRLDADDELLRRRIRERGTPHPVLRMSPEEAAAFFERVRRSHDRILAAIQRASPATAVIRVDTGELAPHEAVERILDLALSRARGPSGARR